MASQDLHDYSGFTKTSFERIGMLLLKNQNSTGGKLWSSIAAFILALTCMPGLTTASLMSKQQNKSSGERTASWKDDHGSGNLKAKNVELTAGSKDVQAIAKGGYLVIDDTRDGVRRYLTIEPAGDGKLKRTFSVDGVTQEMDESGKAWLARILHENLTAVKVMQ
jgi:hypothetical protein